MGSYHIKGGKKIEGETTVHGGKNAILPILASVVLNGSISVIHNCPDISDTHISIEILQSIGCEVKFENNTITVNSKNAHNFSVPEHLVREMRSSIIFLGGVLGRFNQAEIYHPGGCELGQRPIDFHIRALREMNVNILDEKGFLKCETEKIIGCHINLDFPSVGATENIMLTAVLAEGTTVITNAAKEPEIIDLQGFLNAMGAKISGSGTDKIIIHGVKNLHDVEYFVMPDRIVIGTLLTAAAITKGEIIINKINNSHIYPIVTKLLATGCLIKEAEGSIFLKAPKIIKPIDTIRTGVHPGFPKCSKSM